jgi:Tfp pilus assembly protein PilW
MPITFNKRSTSLFEIIVSTVIFALVMSGMVSVFVAGKRQVMHSRERMTSSEMGKLFFDPLQLAVRQDTWDTAANGLRKVGSNYITYCDSDAGHTQNPACPSVGSQRKVNGVDYTARYEVSTVSGTDLRRVKVQTSWTEFSP